MVFNSIDEKPIDFKGALEPTVHYLNISDKDNNSIRYTESNWIANLRQKTNLSKNDVQAVKEFKFDKYIVVHLGDKCRSTNGHEQIGLQE